MLGVPDGPIKDLQYLLEQNGILVTGFSIDEDKIDAFSQRIIVDNVDVFLIAVVLGSRPECRLRFDMAHELGHIVLHPWSEDIESLPKEEFKARERQANMFASAFLLPRDSFSKDISQYPIDLKFYLFFSIVQLVLGDTGFRFGCLYLVHAFTPMPDRNL